MPGRVTSPVFIGRREEQTRLLAAFERAVDGHPSMILVDGEAGIGKSRLVGELVERVRTHGDGRSVLVLEGGCVALGESGLPFAPIVEALRSLVAQVEPSELAYLVGPAAVDLARLVPELSDRPEREPSPFQGGAWLQARIFEAFLGLLGRLGEATAVLLVIEDLHWADESTRDLLAFLARNLRAERLAIVATIRTDDLHRGHPLLPWLAEMERLGRVERFGLARFDRGELIDQLTAILPEPPSPALIDSVLGRSDGNPFFAEEIVTAGGDRATGSLPATLRELLLVRVTALSPTARALLHVAAVAGRQVDPELLAEVAGMSEPEFEAAAREALAARLLVLEPTPARERFAFRHALVQEATYDDLLPGQRRRLHMTLAEALERRGPTSDGGGASRMAELAFHWNAARDRPRALVASLAAAHGAEEEYAFADAGLLYERVLESWASVPEAATLIGTDVVAVLADASRAAGLAGQATRSLTLAREALERFDVASDPQRAALLEERVAWAATEFGDVDLATEMLESATGRLFGLGTPSLATALVSTAFARNQYLRGVDGAIAAAHRAIEAARSIGARSAEADALITLAGALRDVGDPGGAIGHLHEAIAIAEGAGDLWELGRASTQMAAAMAEHGDVEGAIQITADGFARARELGGGQAFLGPKPMLEQAWRLINIGRWDEAREHLDEVARFAPEGAMRLQYCATAGLLDALSGRLAAARVLLAEARALNERLRDPRLVTAFHVVSAQLELIDDRPDAARREIEEALDGDLRGNQDVSILCRYGMEAEADLAEIGRARRRPGDVEAARGRADAYMIRLEVLVRTFPDLASPGMAWLAADRALVEAERTRLEGRPAPDRWAEVADRSEAMRQPYESACARYRQGEALLAEGHRRGEAEEAIRSAHEVAVRLGALPLQARIEALARRGRIDLGGAAAVASRSSTSRSSAPEVLTTSPESGTDVPAAPADPFGLTVREREVLVLLAQGQTNRQVGDALFISTSTAGVHVSNILGKLGVTSRVEAAAIAVRLGLAS